MPLDKHSLIKGYNRAKFYVSNFASYAMPDALFRHSLQNAEKRLSPEQLACAAYRAAYYVRLPLGSHVSPDARTVGSYKYPFGEKHKFATYFFDLFENVRCFDPNLKFDYIFGDVNYEPQIPAIVKSRPIVPEGMATNAALCKLNKVRHFKFVNDIIPFEAKSDIPFFRAFVAQPHRLKFMQMYAADPLCDIGQTNPNELHPEYVKPFVPIADQLRHKFICCIEGNDVATSLKWVMSSNSLAVMPKPKMESWFMEGRLIADYHYVQIRDDFSDLIEKTRYYAGHPEKAAEIIRHAHEWVDMFKDKDVERYTSLLAMQYYFMQTGQC